MRNYGVRLICATQNPSEMASGLRNNLTIKYIFGLVDSQEMDVVIDDFAYIYKYPDRNGSRSSNNSQEQVIRDG